MRKYSDVVQDQFGNGLSGASVQVNISGGGAATLYSDQGVTPITNPLTTDAQGRFAFYVVDGRYDFIISGSGITSNTQSDIEVSDIAGNLNVSDIAAHFKQVGVGTNSPSATLDVVGTGAFTGRVDVTGIVGANGGLSISSGIGIDGSGFKHKRVSTGSVAASTRAVVSFNWGTAFADANYTMTCTMYENAAGATAASLRVERIRAYTSGAVDITVFNDDAGSARTGTIHVIAVHD